MTAADRQPIEVLQVDPRILALLDILAEMPPTHAVLWSYTHPLAAATLRLWCGSRGIAIEESIGDRHHALSVWRDSRLMIVVRLDDPRIKPAAEPRLDVDREAMWRPTDGAQP